MKKVQKSEDKNLLLVKQLARIADALEHQNLLESNRQKLERKKLLKERKLSKLGE